MKLKDSANHETDDASEDLSIKRAPLESDQEDLETSTRESSPAARLSDNNFSLTQLRPSAGNENRTRSSKSYVPAGENKVRRATSRKIVQIDYSRSGYSRFCSSGRQKREQPQNHTELSEYSENHSIEEYFRNILPADNDSDTSEEARKSDHETPRNDAQSRILSAKFAKSGSPPSSTSVENGIVSSRRTKKTPLKQQKYQLRSNGVHSEILNRRRGKRKKRKGYMLRQKKVQKYIENSSSGEESSPESESNLKDSADNVNNSAKIIQKRCNCDTRRSSKNFVCRCKKNLKETADAIMQEIRAHLYDAEVTKDIENVRNTISEFTINNSSDEQNIHFDQNISMEYNWNTDEFTNMAERFQKVIQSSTNVNPEESSTNVTVRRGNRGEKKRLNGSSIDYTFDDGSKTAYKSVFHECVDTPTPTSSLKINVEESWISRDSDSDIEMTHSSWRQSSLIEGCGEKFDSSLLLGRKSDDSISEKSCSDVHETMSGACYKYRESPDIFVGSGNNSAYSNDDTEISNRQSERVKTNNITYGKNRTMSRSSSVDLSMMDEKDEKIKNQYFKVNILRLQYVYCNN